LNNPICFWARWNLFSPDIQNKRIKEAIMTHPIRFGIMAIQDTPWSTLVEHWKHIEALGYDSVWVGDHFLNPHAIEEGWFDGWSVLAAMATQTSTIRIGTLVTNIIYRNPALIARQAQTLDHISGGRLNLGIGATSERDPSQHMLGIENWSTPERVARFREVIEIVDLMLRHETTTYQGRYYQVDEARLRPPSIQKPRPPLTLAAMGPTTLKVAAQYADTWNTYGGWNLPPQQNVEVLRQQRDLLEEHCAKIGRDPGEIRHSFLVGVSADAPFASLEAFHDFVGRYHEIGMDEFILYYDYPDISLIKSMNRAMLERIATEAIPVIRSAAAG
jgi:alkanesulfonate monooxygenase SsuD/methylene tetrahydromethanopterin reductase-like flavin-dependent oxidoreductase (luciferase family)